MLSTLNSDQQKALTTFNLVEAKASPKIKKLFETQSYGKIYNALSTFQDVPFSEQAFIEVGMMSQGLRNAHFFLVAIEASGKEEAIEALKTALATHCWARVAAQINEKLTDPARRFSDSDLQFAHNPNDRAACASSSPGGVAAVLLPVIGAGSAVAGFFAGTLPEFFTNEVSNFFTNDVSGFFTGDFVNFFNELGDGFMNGVGVFSDIFTEDVGGVFGDIGDAFESGFGEVSDWFGGLF